MSLAVRVTFAALFVTSALCLPLSAQVDPTTDLTDLQPFVPRTPRSEADEDRILSSTLFAEGRLLFRREKYPEALKRYERAYRYSNQAATILSEIVPLSLRQGREEEAARYAKLADSDTKIDPFILRRLAVLLTEQERLDEAARLYELTTAVPADDDLQGAAVITQFELGRIYFLIGQYAKACDAFDRVISVMDAAKEDSADAAAIQALLKLPSVTYSLMGESNFLADRLDQAEQLFRKAEANQADQPLLAFHLARIADKRDEVDEALQQLQVYLNAKLDSAGTSPYQLLADLLKKKGQSDQLMDRLGELRKQQPDNDLLGYFLADEYVKAEEFEKAARIYRQVIEDQPSVDAYQGLTTCYLEMGDDVRLLEILGRTVADLNGLGPLESQIETLTKNRDRIRSLAEIGRERLGDDPAETMRPEAIALASLAAQAEQFEMVDEFYGLIAGQAPKADAQIWIAWGLEMLLADQTDRAIEIFQTMLDERIPGRRTGEVLYYLSGALSLKGRYDEALAAATDAAGRSKGIPAIEMRPAWTLYLARRWDEAKQAYLDFLAQYEDNYDSNSAREAVREAKMTLSNICVYREEFAEGIEWLEQVLDEYPSDIGAQNDLGYLWADQGVHLQRALEMTQSAVAAEPESPAYLDSLGWTLYRLGRYKEAIKHLRKAVDADVPDPIILDHLADALQESGDSEQARKIWQQALDKLTDEQDKDRQRIKSKLEQ